MNVKDLIVEKLCETQSCICYARNNQNVGRYALNQFLKQRTDLVQMLKECKKEV